MKDLCLFDLDGTLTDPKIGITKSVNYALGFFDIHEKNLDDLKKFIGPPLRDSFKEYYGFNTSEAEKAVSKYREYFSETGIFENTLYSGITEILSRLKSENILLAIATSKPIVYAERIADHFNLKQYFEVIAGSEFDGTRSRKSEVIEFALNMIDPEREKSAVMIGDRAHDIIGAKETGVDSVGVTWGYGSRTELIEAGATWLADSPDELYSYIMGELS